MSISGIFIIQDGIYLGYPFLESILSVISIVDKFLLNDAGSKDGTFDCLKRLKKLFPKKIFLYQIPSFKSEYFEWIDKVLNRLIQEAPGDWIIEVQGDEVWHENDVGKIREILTKKTGNYNSLRQRRIDCNWSSMDSYEYRVIRIFRNIPGIKSYFGGDNFRPKGAPPRERKYATHDIPPELEIDIPFYHFGKLFPTNTLRLYKRYATFVATKDKMRKKLWEVHKQHHF